MVQGVFTRNPGLAVLLDQRYTPELTVTSTRELPFQPAAVASVDRLASCVLEDIVNAKELAFP
jgi:hypothetical protein